MSVRRRLTTVTGAVLLTFAVAGCSGLGRTAVGTIKSETQHRFVVTVTSPLVKGCHRLPPSGVTRVENNALTDIIMYRTRNCDGPNSIYVPTNSANWIAPDTLPWRSYSVVH